MTTTDTPPITDEQTIASTRLLTLLRTLSDRPFYFVTPGGNWGDELIYHGMHRLAALAGVEYETLDHNAFMAREIPAGSAVYIHGSGGYVPWWGQTPVYQLHKAATTPGVVAILGPSSYADDPQYLDETLGKTLRERTCEQVHLFTRERVSFDAVSQTVAGADATVYLEHDTALNLTRDDVLRLAGIEPNPGRGYRLLSLRLDHEKTDKRQQDLRYISIDPVFFANSFAQWVRLHENAREVVANRLHSAILSTILGKRVTLIPNSWHKNRGVWEQSLRDRGTLWSDSQPRGWMTRLFDSIPPLSRAAHGNFGRRVRMRLAGFRE